MLTPPMPHLIQKVDEKKSISRYKFDGKCAEEANENTNNENKNTWKFYGKYIYVMYESTLSAHYST